METIKTSEACKDNGSVCILFYFRTNGHVIKLK
jgi:hypothetical protein